MWIILRLVLAASFAIVKLFRLWVQKGESITLPSGRSVYLNNFKTKNGSIVKTVVSIRTQSFASFQLLPEGRFLRFLKRLGLGGEIQTGERDFDERFYIASDDVPFLHRLTIDSEFREAFTALANHGWKKIACTKKWMTISCAEYGTLDSAVASAIDQIVSTLERISNSPLGPDRYTWRIVTLELVLYAGLGYAIGGYLEFSIDSSVRLIDPWPLVWFGVKVSIATAVAWLALVYLAIRKSSRAPLLITESIVGLIFGLILGVPQVVVDLNRGLDKSQPEKVTVIIDEKSSSRGPGRRSRTYHYLHLHNSTKYGIGPKLKISSLDYWRFNPPQKAEVIVHEGFFKSRYIADLVPGEPVSANVRNQSLGQSTSSGIREDLLARARRAYDWAPQVAVSDENNESREDHWPGGKLRSREKLVRGQVHGMASYWHANGQLYAQIPYESGLKNGRFRLFREDGTVESDLSMKKGQPHGHLVWYDQRNQIQQQEIYDEGERINLTPLEWEKLLSR